MDFGTDAVRAILIEPNTNDLLTTSVSYYSRWKEGLYNDPSRDCYRQHPRDYIESIDEVLLNLLNGIDARTRRRIIAIGTCTTASTPIAVDRFGVPLALLPEFEQHPNAMFVLWKDHTAIDEAAEINNLAKSWPVDYTKYSGGLYSSEWFWAKILHIHRSDKSIREKAYSWLEQSDWIPLYLVGGKSIHGIKRNRGAAGHKGLWHASFGGYPKSDFLHGLHPSVGVLGDRMPPTTYTSDEVFGYLDDRLREKFRLPEGILITVGGIDAHHGAVGAGIRPHTMIKVMGTSTCDLLVAPNGDAEELIEGICGQVDGSILPNMVGYEAGQSAYGDIFSWYKKLMMAPFFNLADDKVKPAILEEIGASFFTYITDRAAKLPVKRTNLVFTDYLNGRRSPDADLLLKASARGFELSVSAEHIFKALVEAAAFGSRAIKERFEKNGMSIESIIATGGIPARSPFVVQVLANVLECEVHVTDSIQAGALGSAIFASVAAKLFHSLEEARFKMVAKVKYTYKPDCLKAEVYRYLYGMYRDLAKINI